MIVGVPFYIFLRTKMVRQLKKGRHNKTRVLRLTIINILLVTLMSLQFCIIFGLLLLRGFETNAINITFLLIFLLTLCLAYYGNGIYITSIILEDFTLPNLKKITSFKTQFIATHLFHGPISHLLIYTSMMYSLMILALFDIFNQSRASDTSSVNLLIVYGAIAGLLFGIGQIYNGTYPYQLIASIIAYIFFQYTTTIYPTTFELTPVGSYFYGYIISVNVSLISYIIYRRALYNELPNWDASGH